MNILRIEDDHYLLSDVISTTNKLENGSWYRFTKRQMGLCLEKIKPYILPDTFYDFKQKERKIILNSFNGYSTNLGVLFEGSKGTGKTVDAKKLIIESNLPVIVVDSKISGNVEFGNFLNQIEQDFCIFIDEFDKLFLHYDSDNEDKNISQIDLLSILDGSNNKYKKLFVFTSNTKVNEYLINRPSRIKFHLKYKGISKKDAEYILQKELKNANFVDDLLNNLNLNLLTIDILRSIIKEINIQNIPYSEFKDIFNFKETSSEELYELYEIKGKKKELVDDQCYFEYNYLRSYNDEDMQWYVGGKKLNFTSVGKKYELKPIITRLSYVY